LDKRYIAVAFTGPSNNGKTTLIVKLSSKLKSMGFKVAIIKHDPHDKAIFDKEGKDSYKFSQTGANVAVVSPNRTTILKQETTSIDNIALQFGEFDFLLVEGLKSIPLPRIYVCRKNIDEEYFESSSAVAFDETIEEDKLPKNLTKLNLDNLDNIIKWIEKNGKKYE
jgi:molybdopterin-guanine dinucleotide biosynthesis protein B